MRRVPHRLSATNAAHALLEVDNEQSLQSFWRERNASGHRKRRNRGLSRYPCGRRSGQHRGQTLHAWNSGGRHTAADNGYALLEGQTQRDIARGFQPHEVESESQLPGLSPRRGDGAIRREGVGHSAKYWEFTPQRLDIGLQRNEVRLRS